MAILEFRNAYYRGWFAARAHRPAPDADAMEEHFFIDMGFEDGKMSPGHPLQPWNKSIEPGVPANVDIEVHPDKVVFTTRRPGNGAWQPAVKPFRPEATASATPSSEPEPESADTVEDHPAQLPEKKPQYSLPSRPAYGGGVKRRPTRFKG